MTKAKNAWDAVRFTTLDIPAHPDFPDECPHQRPRHLATRDGWPRCADCRAALKAKMGEYTPREPMAPAAPAPEHDTLSLDVHARAAGAHLEDRT